MIAHFRGILADSLEVGDLLEGEVADDPQRDHRPLSWRQPTDTLRQPVAQPRICWRIPHLREVGLGDVVEWYGSLAPLGALQRANLVEGDSIEPAPEGCFPAEGDEVRVGLNERGLHDLVGYRMVPEPAVHQRVYGALMSLDECLEALRTPGKRAGDELRIVHAACTST